MSRFSLPILATLLLVPSYALAQGPTQSRSIANMTISASVQIACSNLNAPAVNVGSVLNSDWNAPTTVEVNCSESVPFAIGFDHGQNPDFYGTRRMSNGAGDYMAYYLTDIFGNGVGDSTCGGNTYDRPVLHGTGQGTTASIPFHVKGFNYGAEHETLAPGSYTDTVKVTLCF